MLLIFFLGMRIRMKVKIRGYLRLKLEGICNPPPPPGEQNLRNSVRATGCATQQTTSAPNRSRRVFEGACKGGHSPIIFFKGRVVFNDFNRLGKFDRSRLRTLNQSLM